MDDAAYYGFDDDGRGAFSQRDSRFPALQSQSRQPTRTRSNRDQFRFMQHSARGYDDVEDDGPSLHDDGIEFDSFDDRLLQQPYSNRQQQAKQGRARLSLAPGPSRFFSNAPPSQVQSQVPYQPREYSVYENDTQRQDHYERPAHGSLGRFAYNGNEWHEASSDMQLGPSSSPAFKAGRRRAEHDPSPLEHPGSAAQQFQIDRRRTNEPQTHLEADHFQQCAPRRTRSREDQPDDFSAHQHQAVVPTLRNQYPAQQQPRTMNMSHAPPICQGIRLVPISALPDRLRTVFPYPTFNAVQSKCFDTIFRSDDNFVLASPTGSGKTVILELAICRAVATNATGQYKIVYQAPTKALCSERQRDWATKFGKVGLTCAELTGDSDATDVRNVQSANIIITTPEKWDSITRKWKDHEKLMRLIKVFLIDEVHILKEDRGAVLEAVVSRMKSIGTDVRFVALSATIPNFHDIATWLGKNSSQPHMPAPNANFGEEFRPVKLQKHVRGYTSVSNDFGFEKVLDGKLSDIITKYSEGKPIMIFCATRTSCVNTARLIANWWTSRPGCDRKWNGPTRQLPLLNKDLRETAVSGVAFHHAGLDMDDRAQVEKGFLSLDINVICCTSTLAVGVNLPCHLVIIKNTVTYTDEGLQEYSDLEMMQMLGRAGRPQFGDTAVAVIMTRQTKMRRYEMMVTGQELLESKLHSNLIDHMNAEIGLGTIPDLASARKWLKGTFLYVRLQQNPKHYKLEGARSGQNIEEQADDICFRDIALLREHNLVHGDEHFRCTEFGHAMARYYVHFETMKVFMGIQPRATPSEILSAIAQASEFSKLRFRAVEKPFYKSLNKSPSTRFAIPVNLDLPAHKVSLIIQSVLGSADLSWDGEMAKHRQQYTVETQLVFKNVNSLIRCIIDCQICLGDSVSIHSALMLERSLGSRIWDDSPLQMKQIDSIGVIGVRKFVNAGIRSMEDLEACDAHRIEALIGRNPPYGMKILETVKAFPKLRVSLHVQSSSITKCADGVKIQVKADIGFINQSPPLRFASRLVYVCLLAETSDGRKVHFARISGQKLGRGQTLVFPALLTGSDQSINCYVMCDSIAGTLRGATVKPQVAPSMFPVAQAPESALPQRSNTSKRRAEPAKPMRKRSNNSDDFGDDGIDDEELVKATCGDLEFEHIDNFANPTDAITRKKTVKNKSTTKAKGHANTVDVGTTEDDQEPLQLSNGKWACKHACKDKNACKHLCCKQGMDKPPKKPIATKHTVSHEDKLQPAPSSSQIPKVTQSKLQLTASKRKVSSAIEELDLTQDETRTKKTEYVKSGPRNYREPHQLHKTIQKKDPPSILHSVMHTKPTYCYSQGGEHTLSFLHKPRADTPGDWSDYGDVPFDELSSHFETPKPPVHRDTSMPNKDTDADTLMDYATHPPVASRRSDTFGDDDSLLGDVMIGLADSQTLQAMHDDSEDNTAYLAGEAPDIDFDVDFQDDDFATNIGFIADDHKDWPVLENAPTTSSVPTHNFATDNRLIPFYDITSSLNQPNDEIIPGKTRLTALPPQEHIPPKPVSPALRLDPNDAPILDDIELLDLLDTSENQSIEKKPVPEAFKELEPWLYQEFGDIVELVDG